MKEMQWQDMVTQFIDSSKLICVYEFCPGVGIDLDDRQQVIFIYQNSEYADIYAYHSENYSVELEQAKLDLQRAGIDIEYSPTPSLDFYSRVLYPPCDLNKEYYSVTDPPFFKKMIHLLFCRREYTINPQLSVYDAMQNRRIIRACEETYL